MLKYLLEKEFRLIKRNPFMPRLIVMFPIMIMLIMPLAANFDVKNLKLVLVDSDKTANSRELSTKVLSSGYFTLARNAESQSEARAAVDAGDADVILEIPSGFERDLIAEKEASVMISANGVNQTRAGLGSSYLAGIVNDYALTVRMKRLAPLPDPLTPSFETVPRYLFNPYLRYTYAMIPALLVMLLAMLCGFLPALNIVGEKEKGTMEQMNVTPVTRFHFILAKLIPHWIIGFVALTFAMIIARLAYGITPAGNIATLYAFAGIFMLAMSGFGLVISNYGKSLQQAMFMIFFFVITWIFLSGLYTPTAGMPAWAQLISTFSPLKYMITVLRSVYLKGSGLIDLAPEFAALTAFALSFNGWAILSYRKTA